MARFISIVGHPFALLSLLVFLVQARRGPQDAVRTTFAFTVLVLVPLGLLIWRSRAYGRWRTVDASDKADRPVLYATIGLVLFAAGVYFHVVEGSAVFVRGCVVVGSMMLVAFALNHWIKLSLHVAFASFCGVLLSHVYFSAGLLILLLVPPLIWSRLVLSRHVLSETIGGLILGCFGASILIRP
ncbi:MAG: hypothetical protein ABR526_11585 [Chthoniobacterales bacterium]